MPEKPIIKTENLSVTYFPGKTNEVRALKNTDVEIYPGEFIIFFGPSGCGKSTLLYAIAGLETGTEGLIEVQDYDVRRLSRKQFETFHQKTIGMIFQAFYLIPSISVLQNVALPQVAIRVPKKDRQERAMELLTHFGVEQQAKKLPTELSGGQQQRVAIARALVNDPDIIFADEPVGNLDSKSAGDVIQLIQDLNQKQGKTVVLVTHDPSHLHIADRVFHMRDGQILKVQVNKSPERSRKTAVGKKEEAKETQLGMLVETFSRVGQEQDSGLLLEYTAKQIVTSALTGLTIDQVNKLERYVVHMVKERVEDKKELLDLIDKDESLGGLGLNKKSATRLADHIAEIIGEIREVTIDLDIVESNEEKAIKDLRYYLLDTFDTHLRSTLGIDAVERAIHDRLAGLTDRRGVEARLGMPIDDGGAGIDRRRARRMARRLEVVLLGRFVSDQINQEEIAAVAAETKKRRDEALQKMAEGKLDKLLLFKRISDKVTSFFAGTSKKEKE